MTWIPLAVVAVVFVLATVAVTVSRSRNQRCPTCGVGYEVVSAAGQGVNGSYDVLACPHCSNTATVVRGARSFLPYCPSCGNRTLETPTVRLPGETVRVEVREHCPLCHFERTFTVGDLQEPVKLGKVLAFPRKRVVKADDANRESGS